MLQLIQKHKETVTTVLNSPRTGGAKTAGEHICQLSNAVMCKAQTIRHRAKLCEIIFVVGQICCLIFHDSADISRILFVLDGDVPWFIFLMFPFSSLYHFLLRIFILFFLNYCHIDSYDIRNKRHVILNNTVISLNS